MRGRKPIPTKLKIVRGNPGKRALNDSEPKPSSECIPHVPKHLSPGAKAEWRRISKKLWRLGLLTELDTSALGAYCDAYDRWVTASASIQKDGMVIENAGGYLVQSPYVTIAHKSVDQMTKLLVEFGMTPSSRSRLHVEQDVVDPFEAFLARGDKQKRDDPVS